MLREASSPYLVWARRAVAACPRVSLLASGLDTPLDLLGVPHRDLLEEPEPAFAPAGVAARLAARYGVPESEVLPVLGTSQGLFLAAAALLAPGDRVAVETPGYDALNRVPLALGATLQHFPRGADGDLDPDAIPWHPHPPRLVLVSDLHNPTGRRASPAALTEVARRLAEVGGVLLVDEVYRDFLPGPPGTARSLGGNVVTVSSLTKVYGLSRLRAGWVLAPAQVVLRMQAIRDVMEAVDPAPVVPLIRAALDQADLLRDRARETARAVHAVAERHADRLDFAPADGGITRWVRLPGGLDGEQVARELLSQHGVAVVPGAFFGVPGALRVGSGSPEGMERGLAALAATLEKAGSRGAKGSV